MWAAISAHIGAQLRVREYLRRLRWTWWSRCTTTEVYTGGWLHGGGRGVEVVTSVVARWLRVVDEVVTRLVVAHLADDWRRDKVERPLGKEEGPVQAGTAG